MADEIIADQAADQAATTAPDWYSTLPPELQADKTVSMFKGKPVAEAIKSGLEARKMIGHSIVPPTDKDTPEEAERKLNEIYGKLGRPETPEKYEIPTPEKLPEGMAVNADLVNMFKGVAHKAGLSVKQAKAVAEAFNQFNIAAYEAAQAGITKTVEDLRTEWGAKADVNFAAAKRFVQKFADEKDAAALDGGEGNNPALIRILAKAGAAMGEDRAIPASHTDAGTIKTIDARMNEIRSDPAYGDRHNPKNQQLFEELKALYAQKAELQGTAGERVT